MISILLNCLREGDKLALEYGNRVTLQRYGVVVAVGAEAVEALLAVSGGKVIKGC